MAEYTKQKNMDRSQSKSNFETGILTASRRQYSDKLWYSPLAKLKTKRTLHLSKLFRFWDVHVYVLASYSRSIRIVQPIRTSCKPAPGRARGCITSHTPSGHEGVCDQQFLIEAHHSKSRGENFPLHKYVTVKGERQWHHKSCLSVDRWANK